MALGNRPVTIVGGGIGGLTAALALARRGARVSVLEKAGAFREVGAGIQVSPNAGRVLDALGLTAEFNAISIPNHAVELYDIYGRIVTRLDLRQHRPGASFRTVHRARLLAMLDDAARAAGVEIHFATQVTAPPEGDLVIGADGLHSVLRATLNGPETPFFTGQSAWRAVVPLEADAPLAAQVFMGPGRHLVSYPLAFGLRNIVAIEERESWTEESWSQADDPAAMRAAFSDFPAKVRDWLSRVESCGVWGLFRHEVADRWQDGRIALLGDAAHPTLPFLAQGACMAIEDAWVLAACLDADPDQTAALARYEALRKPRTTRIVAAATANARNYHLSGPQRLIGHTLLRTANLVAAPLIFDRFAWVYDYDPIAES